MARATTTDSDLAMNEQGSAGSATKECTHRPAHTRTGKLSDITKIPEADTPRQATFEKNIPNTNCKIVPKPVLE
jgi:hypothetical protein